MLHRIIEPQKNRSSKISESFKKIKEDIHVLNQWINYLHQKQNEQDNIISELKELTVEKDDVQISKELRSIISRLEKLEARKPIKDMRDKFAKKISKNSKQYVKSFILSLIQKHSKISALSIREIVVEERGLCSKSSLYRLLSEIESSEDVAVIQEGKEKVYLYS